MEPKTTETTVAPVAPATMSLTAEQIKSMISEGISAGVKAATATVVTDPSAAIVDAATRISTMAPAVLKHATRCPSYLANREQNSDERCDPVERKGLPMARLAIAMLRTGAGNKRSGFTDKERAERICDELDVIGFRKTAAAVSEHMSLPQNAAMSSGAADAGGSFVPTTTQQGFIDTLQNEVCIRPAFPASSVLSGTAAQIQMPTFTSDVSGGWVGENPTTGNPEARGTGLNAIEAKKMRIEVLLSREMIMDASINLDQVIRSHMAHVAGLLEDLAICEGTGSAAQPRGLALIGTNTATATATPAYLDVRSDILATLKALEVAKVGWGSGRLFIGTAVQKFGLLGYESSGGNAHPFEAGLSAASNKGAIFGVPAVFPNILTSTAGASCRFYAVAPGECVLYDRLGISIEEDNSYLDSSGNAKVCGSSDQTVLRLWRRMGFGIKHATACQFLSTVPWGI